MGSQDLSAMMGTYSGQRHLARDLTIPLHTQIKRQIVSDIIYSNRGYESLQPTIWETASLLELSLISFLPFMARSGRGVG